MKISALLLGVLLGSAMFARNPVSICVTTKCRVSCAADCVQATESKPKEVAPAQPASPAPKPTRKESKPQRPKPNYLLM